MSSQDDSEWIRVADVDPSITDIDPDDELAWARFFTVLRYIQELSGDQNNS